MQKNTRCDYSNDVPAKKTKVVVFAIFMDDEG